jgi:hypothetical protein
MKPDDAQATQRALLPRVGRRWQQVVEHFGSIVDHAWVFSHIPPQHE